MLVVVLFSGGGRGNQVYGIKIVNNSPFNTIILCTGVCYPQGSNNKYVTNIYYYYIYSIILFISYEDPVQLSTTTTDPYHISHNEVCTVITNL